jgi:hypothetical protein
VPDEPPLPDDDSTHGQWRVWAAKSQQEQLLKKKQQGGVCGGIRSLEDITVIDPKVLRHMCIDTTQQQRETIESSNEGFHHSEISALKPSRSNHDEAGGGDGTGWAASRRRASPRNKAVAAAVVAAVQDDAGRRDRTSSGRR